MTPKGYSATQIGLHWLVVLLIAAQFLLADGMEAAWETIEDGGQKVMTTGAAIHIALGMAVLVIALWRLALRFRRGVPAPPEGEGAVQVLVAKVTHGLLYVLMIGLPLGGIAAWGFGIAAAAEAHAAGTTVLLILIALHVLGTVYNQWIVGNGLIRRMMRPET